MTPESSESEELHQALDEIAQIDIDKELVRAADADYGIDAPEAVRNFALGGLLAVAVGVILRVQLGWIKASIAVSCIGGCLLIMAGLLVSSSKVWKRRECDRLLDSLGLRGDERVLDAGCGRGLLLIGAAKRLTSGHAAGVDLWTKDQSGNSPDAAVANARAEGVSDRVTVTSGDVQQLPFNDATFDVVVSNLVLDNIHSEEGWTRAVREIARVLKPGGRVLIADLAHTEQYEATLREEGWSEVERSGLHFRIFPPVRVVAGSKPTR